VIVSLRVLWTTFRVSKSRNSRRKRDCKLLTLAFVLSVGLVSSVNAQQCTNTQFVQRAYADLLFRQPAASELSFYLPAVQSLGRQSVALSMINSQEFSIDLIGANPSLVTGFYQTFLGRNPTQAEAQTFVGLEPTSDSSIIGLLLGSPEYQSRANALNPGICDPNQRLVNQMFRDLLGRNATGNELDTFGTQLARGTSASNIAGVITGSTEYFGAVVNRAYLRLLRRPATPTEISLFVAFLKADARPEEDLLAVLAGSTEYCNQAGVQPPPAFLLQPPANTFGGLNSITIPANLATLPAVQFGPAEAASNAAVLGLQGTIAADDANITALNSQISGLNNLVGGQAQTIADLANTLFGAAPTLSAAQAAQSDAQDKVAQALAAIGATNSLVQNAQSDLKQGDAALTSGDYSTAVKRYRLAFLHAGNALR
jgi:hypothetical protein